MPNIKDKPLTAGRQAFVEYYAEPTSPSFNNAAQSYKRAYPSCNSGYEAHGARLIANDNVKQAISQYKAKLQQKVEFTREKAQANNDRILELAIKSGQLSAAVSANNSNMRLFALDQQVIKTEHVEPEPTADEAEALKKVAESYKLKLVKSTG
jgi:hypothetical protein